MGMAASQARYIELAARKTNVEYEGQQINQQRTALANESAGLFNKMLQLNIPTAPNYNEFVKTIYQFSDGTNDYTIDSFARLNNDPSYNAKVNYYYTTTEFTGMYKERSDLNLHWETSSSTGEKLLYYGTKKLDAYDAKNDEAAVRQIYEDTYLKAKDHNIMDGDTLKQSFLNKDYADWLADPTVDLSSKIFKYSSGGTTYYVSADQLSGYTIDKYVNKDATKLDIVADATNKITTYTFKDSSDNVLQVVNAAFKTGDTTKTETSGNGFNWTITNNNTSTSVSYAANATVPTENTHTRTSESVTSEPVQNCYSKELTQKQWQKEVKAYLDKDDSGNYKSITLENYSNTFDLNVYQETDDRAYNQAMNDYVYQKSMYDKNIADINAKTEIIQQEDRTLELKLKQLDTEHKALETEMEAVKKVCDKNVESTFKTFS